MPVMSSGAEVGGPRAEFRPTAWQVDGGGVSGHLAGTSVAGDGKTPVPLLFPLSADAIPPLSLLMGQSDHLSRNVDFPGVPRGAEVFLAGPAGSSFIVAAGRFGAAGETVFAYNGLAVQSLGQENRTLYLLSGDWFEPGGNYMVKGSAVVGLSSSMAYSFDVVAAQDQELVNLLAALGITSQNGIVLRVMRSDNQPVDAGFLGLALEICQYA